MACSSRSSDLRYRTLIPAWLVEERHGCGELAFPSRSIRSRPRGWMGWKLGGPAKAGLSADRSRICKEGLGGAEGNRTPDLCSAIAALSHLSYSPKALAF